MKAVHVISGLEPSHGGPSYSAPRMVGALKDCGVAAELWSGVGEERPDVTIDDRIRLFERRKTRLPLLGKLDASPTLRRRLLDEAVDIDVIHNHGLWRLPNLYAAEAAQARTIPLVTSPRGMLNTQALRRSSVMKRVFWRFGQERALQASACLHATSHLEAEEIRRLGVKTPVAVIANGVDFEAAGRLRPSRGEDRMREALYLGRIHPIKRIDVLIRAWARLHTQFPDWRVRIVGPGEPAHVAEIERAVAAATAPRLRFDKASYGDEKWRRLSGADLFITPSMSENFGMTIAESLSVGAPVIVTSGTPWGAVETHGCGWRIGLDEDDLVTAMRDALGRSEGDLRAMGRRGSEWVRRAYSWTSLAEDMALLYRWLLDQADRPEFVRID